MATTRSGVLCLTEPEPSLLCVSKVEEQLSLSKPVTKKEEGFGFPLSKPTLPIKNGLSNRCRRDIRSNRQSIVMVSMSKETTLKTQPTSFCGPSTMPSTKCGPSSPFDCSNINPYILYNISYFSVKLL